MKPTSQQYKAKIAELEKQNKFGIGYEDMLTTECSWCGESEENVELMWSECAHEGDYGDLFLFCKECKDRHDKKYDLK